MSPDTATTVLSLGILVLISVLVLGAFAQLFIAPWLAKRRGKDAGMWFIIAVLWVVFFSGFAALGMFMLGIGMLMKSGGIMIGLGVALIIFEWLPVLVLLMSSPQRDLSRRRRRGVSRRRFRPPSSGKHRSH